MGSSRKPGSIGLSGQPEDLNDGTMIRALSPRPTPTGSDPASTGGRHRSTSLTTVPSKPARRRTAASTLHVLRQGSRGSEVRKLQQQLNARLTPSPELAVDGIFGPLTRQAILHYQQGVHIPADGVADKQTWYHLLKGDEASILRLASAGPPPALASPRASGSTAPAAPPRTQSENIWEWPLQRKMLAVLQRVPSRLPGKARDEFEALLQIENLALSLAIIAGFCLLGGGSALVFGVVILGLEMTMSLASTLQRAALAATEDELNDAADELAYIVLAIGVAALIKGVGRIAKGVKSLGGDETDRAAEVRLKPVPPGETSQPKLAPAIPTRSSAQVSGLDKGLSDRIRAMEKGTRPDPNTYMTDEQIRWHASEFAGGASRLMLKGNLDKYGPAQRDGTAFFIPKKDVDRLLGESKGDKRALEKALGLPDHMLDADQLVRIDVQNTKAVNLRIPSGNEAGANSHWLPGGKLPEGHPEAVVDLRGAPKGTWTVKPIDP